jgi:hypothetical protein
MESKQTATEWLIEQVKSPSWSGLFIWHKEEIFQQALTMEKNQIMKTFDDCGNWEYECKGSEDYYNKTYKK